MSPPRAIVLPTALVVVLTVVGAWIDGPSSSPAAAPASTVAATVAATTTTTVPGPPRTSCTSVVHIGDSTSVGLTSPDYIEDPALRIDAQYARVGVAEFRAEIRGARSVVERYREEENADDVATRVEAESYDGCWVLALGTTDGANLAAGGAGSAAERIDRMMAIVGDDPVLWVNVKTLVAEPDHWANSSMLAWNEALEQAAGRHPNLRVYDWASVVEDDWFQDDGIHYTSAGNAERARLIADALLAAFPA